MKDQTSNRNANQQHRSNANAVFLIVAFFSTFSFLSLTGCRNESAAANGSSVKDVPVVPATTGTPAYRVVVIGSDGVQKQVGVLAPGENKTFGFQYSLKGTALTIGTATKPVEGSNSGGGSSTNGKTDPGCLYPNDPSCDGGSGGAILVKKPGIKDQCITGNEPGCKPPTPDR